MHTHTHIYIYLLHTSWTLHLFAQCFCLLYRQSEREANYMPLFRSSKHSPPGPMKPEAFVSCQIVWLGIRAEAEVRM